MVYEIVKRDKVLLRVQSENVDDVATLCVVGSSLREHVNVEFISAKNPSIEIDLIGFLKYTVKL